MASHFLLVPLMAQGHMIPMFDIARLFASRGVKVTLVTTPANASRFTSVAARSIAAGLDIRVVELEFPVAKAGLPDGCENLDTIPSPEMAGKFLEATEFLRQPFEELFSRLEPRPNCVVSDAFLPFTYEVAQEFGVPRIAFNGLSCFCLLGMYCARTSGVFEKVSSDMEKFVIPGFPDAIEFNRLQIQTKSYFGSPKFFAKILETLAGSYGMIVNSFKELEPAYAKAYRKVKGDKLWVIGPVSSYNKDYADKAERGNKPAKDAEECTRWLDKQEKGSVLYACMGSLCNLKVDQLKELAMGLEESMRPFIWAIRGNYDLQELDDWVSQTGYEEKLAGRGFLIRGWSPQVLILSHPSVGGFLTHCGWNSTLEGISSGTPLLTWPLFGDQFYNEKLVVEVVKTGVSIGAEVPIGWGNEEQSLGVMVTREDVRRGVQRLMDEGDEGEELRRRARELAELAKKAMDVGGSSYVDLSLLISEIMENCHLK
ncbi:hypothetical protein MLD38_020360 [Melastoma candidum]|uniref:Uncharacterized protein n=1 Tax=Melastoma candidum TaxID=119954 RepID=A0ACB9QCT7_9MYRT|nr:hypothetical protein MLD38_020360 [Melastoma candidum]